MDKLKQVLRKLDARVPWDAPALFVLALATFLIVYRLSDAEASIVTVLLLLGLSALNLAFVLRLRAKLQTRIRDDQNRR